MNSSHKGTADEVARLALYVSGAVRSSPGVPVRFARDLGTRAASRAMKSVETDGRPCDVATQALQPLTLVRRRSNRGIAREAVSVSRDRFAFYYVCVPENPTCRWTTRLANSADKDLPDDLAATVQERGWSSPIWPRPR